jgi:hypothetical protein
MKRLLSRLSVLVLFAGGLLLVQSTAAQAYGGDGKMDVYQIGISFNCNNRSLCGDELGGFWGWAELDHDPATGLNTGDAEFAGCSHGSGFNGAAHTSVEITNWWTGDGSAGPNTLFTDEVDTTTFRGTTTVETFLAEDTGVALVPGHQSTTDLFGFQAPGVAAQVQIAFKPAR